MSAENEVVRVYSSAAGAASVMREFVVARPGLSAQLIEGDGGRWQVVIRRPRSAGRQPWPGDDELAHSAGGAGSTRVDPDDLVLGAHRKPGSP